MKNPMVIGKKRSKKTLEDETKNIAKKRGGKPSKSR
jgi:hypothetical protein